MKLAQLCPDIKLTEAQAAIDVGGIALDSRKVKSGDLFVALKGHAYEGTKYIPSAIAKGAGAVFYESGQSLPSYDSETEVIAVEELKKYLGEIAKNFYSKSDDLLVVGVTGTNGKSTCCSLIAQLYQLAGKQAGVVGTLGYGITGEPFEDTGVTTPDVFSNHRILKELQQRGCHSVAMEASSHGLLQNRLAGIQINSAVYTNLTQDHLDYHKTFDDYAEAKKILFKQPGLKKAVVNLDADYAQDMIAAAGEAKIVTYALRNDQAALFASNIRYTSSGIAFELNSPWGSVDTQINLYGEFNVANVLAAIGVYCESKADFDFAIAQLDKLKAVPGRMEFVKDSTDIVAVIDYAHTPDALEQASKSLLQHLTASASLWVVFGCGGDRDREKRSKMGAIAEKYGHKVVVTSDNPRTEDPQAIIDDICEGLNDKSSVKTISDRKDAISYAVENASFGDIVLVAGKGHEDYQDINGQRHYFSDIECAKALLAERAKEASRI